MPDNLHGPLGNVSDCADPGDTAWISLSTILVLTMMPALALFEAGLLRSQNTVSVLTQVSSQKNYIQTDVRGTKWQERASGG